MKGADGWEVKGCRAKEQVDEMCMIGGAQGGRGVARVEQRLLGGYRRSSRLGE